VPRTKSGDDEAKLAAAEHALQKMKTIRHPTVLKMVHGLSDGAHVYIVTEPVGPGAAAGAALPS
jgi:hypothetical protein